MAGLHETWFCKPGLNELGCGAKKSQRPGRLTTPCYTTLARDAMRLPEVWAGLLERGRAWALLSCRVRIRGGGALGSGPRRNSSVPKGLMAWRVRCHGVARWQDTLSAT